MGSLQLSRYTLYCHVLSSHPFPADVPLYWLVFIPAALLSSPVAGWEEPPTTTGALLVGAGREAKSLE